MPKKLYLVIKSNLSIEGIVSDEAEAKKLAEATAGGYTILDVHSGTDEKPATVSHSHPPHKK